MATFFTGESGVGTGPHLDFRIWDVAKGSYVDPRGFTDVLTVGGKPLTEQFGVTSGYQPGGRMHPTEGVVKPHLGVDYGTPMNTPVEVAGERVLRYRQNFARPLFADQMSCIPLPKRPRAP